jgi:hypothetical protein
MSLLDVLAVMKVQSAVHMALFNCSHRLYTEVTGLLAAHLNFISWPQFGVMPVPTADTGQ